MSQTLRSDDATLSGSLALANTTAPTVTSGVSLYSVRNELKLETASESKSLSYLSTGALEIPQIKKILASDGGDLISWDFLRLFLLIVV